MLQETFEEREPVGIEKAVEYVSSLKIFRLAKSIVRDRDAAEEVINDALLDISSGYEKSGVRHVPSWCGRVVINSAYNYLRKNRARLKHEFNVPVDSLRDVVENTGDGGPFDIENFPSSEADPLYLAERKDMIKKVAQALDRIPQVYREPLYMHFDGVTNQDIARRFGISLPAAKSRIHRGKLRLKSILESEFDAQTIGYIRQEANDHVVNGKHPQGIDEILKDYRTDDGRFTAAPAVIGAKKQNTVANGQVHLDEAISDSG